ncbi:MAG TPA: FAD-dependent oxidoreductase, partial [Tepidisphaeraceae bacterium]|nr:FAD-dependent oxidoreductase [Tepidisphaeraceae bacterium]
TGALVAYHLSAAGVSVVVLERRDVCSGSTPASTGLLQYEIDKPLTELAKMLGQSRAARAYGASQASLAAYRQLVAELDDGCGLIARPSVYLACEPDDVDELAAEAAARNEIGIDCELLSAEGLKARVGIDRPAAIWSPAAYEVDPQRLCLSLMRAAIRQGARAFARTQAAAYEASATGVAIATDCGPIVRARRVVFATGYETPEFLGDCRCTLKSTYALTGHPVPDALHAWPHRCLVWESGHPYVYARTTPDGRPMIGGEDEPSADPAARDALIPAKAEALTAKFHQLFPAIPLRPDCCWAGTFAETPDGLPYIGEHPAFPLGLFALGYGGNGITFSLIAARILTDAVLGRANGDAALFGFAR